MEQTLKLGFIDEKFTTTTITTTTKIFLGCDSIELNLVLRVFRLISGSVRYVFKGIKMMYKMYNNYVFGLFEVVS